MEAEVAVQQVLSEVEEWPPVAKAMESTWNYTPLI